MAFPFPSTILIPLLTVCFPPPDFQNTNALIFIIDSNDTDRISEARDEIQWLLSEDELKDAVILIFANKQDLPHAVSVSELTNQLGLHSVRSHQWYIQVGILFVVLSAEGA